MTFTSFLIGGGCGFGIQMFANYAAKIPLSRKPWMHVGGFLVGGYIGHKYHHWETELVQDVNELRAAHGMPPLVGTNSWIKYQPPENY